MYKNNLMLVIKYLKGNIPDFVTALKLVNELNIKINDLMEG